MTAAVRLEEHVVPGKRLGRHVHHDPRSLAFLVEPTDTPTSRTWRRYAPIFDQGNLGSCTGNASAGVLGTAPFYGKLAAQRKAGLTIAEPLAVALYKAATLLDPFPGNYPPTDTGSDGLSAAKACQQAHYISGYRHITSLAAAHAAIKTGPFIVGVNWYQGFDSTNARGMIEISGSVRGGHEFEILAYNARNGMWKAVNSWSTRWGWGGYMYFTDATLARLLAEDGDGTVFTP